MSSFRKRMKLERTNYAASADVVDAIDSATPIEAVIQEYILTKKAERAAPRTITEFRETFTLLHSVATYTPFRHSICPYQHQNSS